jgi:hypothetical protein
MHRRTLLAVVLLLSSLSLRTASAAPAPGWLRVDIPATGSYLWRYVPRSLDASQPAPLVVFLHGSGGIPDKYRPFLEDAAERSKSVVALPKSSTDEGWGTATDAQTVDETLRLIRAELPVDEQRIAVAGHSAGGAYAYLLAYTTRSPFSAVFSMAARYYAIDALADTSYKPPIYMYWGTLDPNYAAGFPALLESQWDRLGVAWEMEANLGYGHNNLPVDAVVRGFLFLAQHARPAPPPPPPDDHCVADATTLCLGDGRYRVQVTWKDFQGKTGVGSVVSTAPVAARDSGLFWFFTPANWELLVKVLDGCARNGNRWVFAAATTNVEYTLTVTDTVTKQTATYSNPLGRSAPAVTDTGAFPGCP